MYSFFIQVYSTYKGLFYWLTWMSYLTNIFIGPAISVISYALLGRFAFDEATARFYGLGIIMGQMAFVIVSGITQIYTRDRSQGTISFLYITPANRLVNYISRAILHLPNGILVYGTGLLTLGLLLDMNFSATNWAAFILAVMIATISIAAFSQFLGTFTIVFRDWVQTMVLATGILTIFNGTIIPVASLPHALQGFSQILPITNGLAAIRSAIIGGPASEIYLNILREGIVGAVYLAIGYIGFIGFEKFAIKRGTLDRDTIG
jgi:ABC-2 type transport system permease protein